MVDLVREPNNPHDRMAVAIYTARHVRVGYLRRTHSPWVGSKMDRGQDVRAIIQRVKGRQMEGSPLGLVLRLNMDGEEPELG